MLTLILIGTQIEHLHIKNKDGKYDAYWNLSFEKTVYRWHEDQILTYDNIKYMEGLKIEIVEFSGGVISC